MANLVHVDARPSRLSGKLLCARQREAAVEAPVSLAAVAEAKGTHAAPQALVGAPLARECSVVRGCSTAKGVYLGARLGGLRHPPPVRAQAVVQRVEFRDLVRLA